MSTPDIDIPGYTIHGLLGQGGMATVYLATQESLQRKVAIKLLDDHAQHTDDDFTTRFINEALLIASVSHPKIITIYDVATTVDGRPYIVMEFLAGGDLKQYLSTPLSPSKAISILRDLIEGLDVLHGKGVIHRDIKPANILFRSDGSAVITDFGIAKALDNTADLTQIGVSVGSPSYSSPEQTQCKPLDTCSDIYSLGVVFLEMLLGENPFKGPSHTDTAINHLQMPLPELPHALRFLQPVITTMLAKDPEDRFASCQAVNDALPVNIDAPDDVTQQRPAIHLPITGWAERIKIPRNLPLIMITVIVLTTGYYAVVYESPLDKQINHYLAQAEIHFENNQLIAPPEQNARYYFRQVLLLDETNDDANEGLDRIITRQVDNFNALALARFGEQQLLQPRQDNAVFYFREALALDPDNAQATEGLARVVDEYVVLAQAAFSSKQYDQGFRYTHRGLSVDPDNPDLLQLNTQYRKYSNSVKRLLNSIFD